MPDDNRPFPIQAEWGRSDRWGKRSSCTIPWWLAKEAYEAYVKLFGDSQSLERLAERGGFGREELLSLLAVPPNQRLHLTWLTRAKAKVRPRNRQAGEPQ